MRSAWAVPEAPAVAKRKRSAPLPPAELFSLLNRYGDAIAAPGPRRPWW
jgi:hypothetical protein